MKPVETAGVSGDLEGLLLVAASGASAPAVLAQARSIMERLRSAPLTEPADGAGWLAMRGSDDLLDEQVLCWREGAGPDASLQASWSGGTLASLDVMVGGQAWGAMLSSAGELEFSAGQGVLDSPAEEALLSEQDERWAAGRRRAEEAMARVGGWRCSQCAWYNEGGVALCERCGAPSTAPAAVPGETSTEAARGHLREAAALAAAGAGALMGGLQLLRRLAEKAPPPEKAPPTKPCPGCERPIAQAASACPHCGVTVPPPCPACGAQPPLDSRFCNQCGAPLAP